MLDKYPSAVVTAWLFDGIAGLGLLKERDDALGGARRFAWIGSGTSVISPTVDSLNRQTGRRLPALLGGTPALPAGVGSTAPRPKTRACRSVASFSFGLVAFVGLLTRLNTTPVAAEEPVRLPNGEPLVCVYFFPHWWDPWKSSDEVVRQDFRRLRALGVNTLLLDHEWAQALDGQWALLDRSHRLAEEAGLFIVPWLAAQGWLDLDIADRAGQFEQWYGERVVFGANEVGQTNVPVIYHESLVRGAAKYVVDYLQRYRSRAILRVLWKGQIRPIVSLCVEPAWLGGFDETSNLLFCRWLRDRYADPHALNAAWNTGFADFFEIDVQDKQVFDYAGTLGGTAAHPQAVEDHVEFRSGMVSDSLGRIGALVREAYPEMLFLAEVPYQYKSRNPDAVRYRVRYGGNPSCCDYADVVLFRATGPLDIEELVALDQRRRTLGQKFVLTYRTYSDWDLPSNTPAFERSSRTYAGQAGEHGNGFGFYSWNEMLDTHVACAPAVDVDPTWTCERSERAIGLLSAMVA